jgi:uncharacterized protein (DUF1501 family)
MHSRSSFVRAFFGPLQSPAPRRTLVRLFLRGGADGLALVQPYADSRFRALRPTLSHPDPDSTSADRLVAIDGRFGLHPKLAPLASLVRSGELAIVHAAGSDDQTRSHFEAQDQMEHGASRHASLGSGWVARYLRARGRSGALSAVAIGTSRPEDLRGAPAVSVLETIDDYDLAGASDARFRAALRALYANDDALASAGREALDTLDRLRAMPPAATDAGYPDHEAGRALAEVARLVRANAGLEVACVDLDGWDSHFVQSTLVDDLAGVLARSLVAFWNDLGDRRGDVTLVAMTEFGRRAYENASAGTDHGRASVMLALGGVAKSGVITDWPGLDRLEDPGDLRVTIDYRDVLSELIEHRLADRGVREATFEGYTPRAAGVFD